MGRGERGEASAGEPVLAAALLGMLYADDVGCKKFFLACSLALSLLSFSIILLSISHADEGASTPTTMSAIVLSFSTALVRPFHTVSDCATICIP